MNKGNGDNIRREIYERMAEERQKIEEEMEKTTRYKVHLGRSRNWHDMLKVMKFIGFHLVVDLDNDRVKDIPDHMKHLFEKVERPAMPEIPMPEIEEKEDKKEEEGEKKE